MSDNCTPTGGKPITHALGIELRQLTFGTAGAPLRCEWIQTPFIFLTSKEGTYGLKTPRNSTRGLISVLQGFIIRNLLFKPSTHRSTTSVSTSNLLLPSEDGQINALISSMVEILSQISGIDKVTIVLPGEEAYIPHSTNYFHDSVTEKLHIFQLDPNVTLEPFLRRNIHFFMGENTSGALLFLYSAILTRTLGKIRIDLDMRNSGITSVVGNMEEGSLTIVTLLLTGRATPYIHNGMIHVSDKNNYTIPQYGILGRCKIGLLLWDVDICKNSNRRPGSRLKTPLLPIWITYCSGYFGVIFNGNQDLLRNYHAESRFDLVYYSCSGHHIKMTIDNRTNQESISLQKDKQKGIPPNMLGSVSSEIKDESVSSPIQRLIHTKWEEANITFHVQPSVIRHLFSTGI